MKIRGCFYCNNAGVHKVELKDFTIWLCGCCYKKYCEDYNLTIVEEEIDK